MTALLKASLIGVMVATAAPHARSTELTVLAPGALRSTLTEVMPALQAETGVKVKAQYASAGQLAESVRKGEAADVAILTRAQIDSLVKSGHVLSGPTPNIAKVGIGVMVKKGDPKPALGTVEDLKKTLRQAKSVGIADPKRGAAGAHLNRVFQKWGMMEELENKLRPLPPGAGLYKAVEAGEVAIAFAPISEIMARAKTLDLVGPVPPEAQNYNRFAAGVLKGSPNVPAGERFIKFLTTDKVASVLRQKGLETGN